MSLIDKSCLAILLLDLFLVIQSTQQSPVQADKADHDISGSQITDAATRRSEAERC